MGFICAPSYSNIFLDHFKRKYISLLSQGFSSIYLRFNDKFFIWTGGKEQLLWNMDKLNTKHDSIKFEYKISKTSISFLDTEVYIKNNKLYAKTELPSHRFRTFQIIKRQYSIQLSTMNQTNLQKFKRLSTSLQELKQQFLELGYNSELLDNHIKTVEKLHRNTLVNLNIKIYIYIYQ